MLGAVACREPAADPRPLSEPVWRHIATFTGRGNAQLETFPIERFTWRVQWETSNAASPGAGTFHLTANSGDSGRILAEVADTTGVGRDTFYVSELPHRYYLVVDSTGLDWTIKVEEPIFQ